VIAVWEWPVVRIIPFEPSIGRGSSLAQRAARLLPLTKRLELLRKNRARAAMAKSQRYRVQAEEYCFQGEIFSDPMMQTRMLLSAALSERRPVRVDEIRNWRVDEAREGNNDLC